MTMAVAHNEKGRVVLDCIGERKAPFSPEAVVAEFAATFKSYRISTVEGDRYAGEWPRERFSTHGLTYRVGGHGSQRTLPRILADAEFRPGLIFSITNGWCSVRRLREADEPCREGHRRSRARVT